MPKHPLRILSLIGATVAIISSLYLTHPHESNAAGTAYYVDPSNGSDLNPGTLATPFRTIEKARDQVKTINSSMIGDITVFLRGGIYTLASTIQFNQRDSGTNGFNVIYQAYPGEKPVLSGGQQLTGWAPVGNGIYKVNAGSLRFRQLYVNGQRAIRARQPNLGSAFWVHQWDSMHQPVIDASVISNWARLNEVELVSIPQWRQINLRIASFSSSGGYATVVPQEPERTINSGHNWGLADGSNAYFFENALEFLDSPGEWYLNTQTNELFYMPRAGENMSTALVVAPVLQTLVQIQGTLDAPIHNLQFYGIIFAHSNWTLPSTQGLVQEQAIWYKNASDNDVRFPSAVMIDSAEHLRFERNIFQDMGTSGLELWAGSHDDTIIGNVFQDIAGTALSIGPDYDSADSRVPSQRIAVLDNYIVRAGQDYRGSVGIWTGVVDSAWIEHNELFDLPYSGFSIGFQFNSMPGNAKNSQLRFNRIHQVMKELADGAGIYTMGDQPGTNIYENYIYDLARSPWAGSNPLGGIYLDGTSSDMTLQNNITENIAVSYYNGEPELLLNGDNWRNTIINFSGRLGDNNPPGANTFITNAIIDPTAIKANAGIESAYQDIKSDSTNYPSLPTLTNPPNSTLPGATVTFQWMANGAPVLEWWLYIGNSQGAHDVDDSGSLGTSLSTTVNGLPTDGRTLFVRLWYRLASGWQARDFQYTANVGALTNWLLNPSFESGPIRP